MRKILGIILAVTLFLLMFFGEFYIIHVVGGYSVAMSIGYVLITLVSAIVLVGWVLLIRLLLD